MEDKTNPRKGDSQVSSYPEHDKVKTIQHLSQSIYDFLVWAEERHKWELGEYGREKMCPVYVSKQDILAEYFEIDLKRLEDEKRQMLDKIRGE